MSAPPASFNSIITSLAVKTPGSPAVFTCVPPSEEDPESDPRELKAISYRDLDRAINETAIQYTHLNPPIKPDDLPANNVIAILSPSNIRLTILELALLKLGQAPLLLSENNSPAAIAQLCKATEATHLIYDRKWVENARAAGVLLEKEGKGIPLLERVRIQLWQPAGGRSEAVKFESLVSPEQEQDRLCLVLHSSGTTGFPKPIFYKHATYHRVLASFPLTDPYIVVCPPLYHAMGHLTFWRYLSEGLPTVLHPGHLPATAGNLMRLIQDFRTGSSWPDDDQRRKEYRVDRGGGAAMVPYSAVDLAKTSGGTEVLGGFNSVLMGGAAFPDDLGDRLTALGVNIVIGWASSEIGVAMTSYRDYANDKDWGWGRVPSAFKSLIHFEPYDDVHYEMVASSKLPMLTVKGNRPDGGYATGDLCIKHSKNDWWKMIGRSDDTVVHISGEKTHAVPIELDIVGQSPLVSAAYVFGRGKLVTGCLLQRATQALDLDRDAFLEQAWPAIVHANSRAPTHSRLLPEMVEVLPVGISLPATDKRSLKRAQCAREHSALIDGLYDRFDNIQADAEKVEINSESDVVAFLIAAVGRTLGGKSQGALVSADQDLYGYGVDSLQAARLRRLCQQQLELGDTKLAQNVVYELGTIQRLATYLFGIITGRVDSEAHGSPDPGQEMVSMLDDFWARCKAPLHVRSTGKKHIVLLTGATGSLGAHLLHKLLQDADIDQVICISRADDDSASIKRIKQSLLQRKLDVTPDAWRKILSLAGDAALANLGLGKEAMASLIDKVTLIIHNAWPVNFSLPLSSFSPQIDGAVNLLNLASSATNSCAFYFCSSISAAMGTAGDMVEESFTDDPAAAIGMGYAQSKWIVENLCRKAGGAGIRAGVFRIGQMSGDSVDGVWTENDAVPAMIRSAQVIHALPDSNEHPSYLPVDISASAIIEIIMSTTHDAQASQPGPNLYHIVNPARGTTWRVLLDYMKGVGLDFEVVPPGVWVKKLESSKVSVEQNPAAKLLPFFQATYADTPTSRVEKVFRSEKAQAASASLRESKDISSREVKRWITYWRAIGFLE